MWFLVLAVASFLALVGIGVWCGDRTPSKRASTAHNEEFQYASRFPFFRSHKSFESMFAILTSYNLLEALGRHSP
jgi:hypothetical protein